jgi:phage/plasmid-associated DNA primase
MSDDPQTSICTFNIQLRGKVLLVLEEMPADTMGQWSTLSSSLKSKITSDQMNLEEKMKTPISIDNHMSIIMSTNKNVGCSG